MTLERKAKFEAIILIVYSQRYFLNKNDYFTPINTILKKAKLKNTVGFNYRQKIITKIFLKNLKAYANKL